MKKYVVDETKDTQKIGSKQGVCPYCGSEMVEFQGSDVQDDMILYEFKCEDCDNSFEEWYLCTYDGSWGYPLKKKRNS